MFCLLSLSLSLRTKPPDGQLLSQHRKSLRRAGPLHCLPAPASAQRQWCQHFLAPSVCQQEGLLLQHHTLSLPEQDHGKEGDGELSPQQTLLPHLQSHFLNFGSSVPYWICHIKVCVYPQEEDLEAQVSFLQGQINDLEAMSKYCAKMMNTHICEWQFSFPSGFSFMEAITGLLKCYKVLQHWSLIYWGCQHICFSSECARCTFLTELLCGWGCSFTVGIF